MSYTTTTKDGSVVVTINLPWSQLQSPYEKAIDKAVKESSENTSAKGFRKGHVPEGLVKGNVDRMQVLSQVVDEGIRADFVEAVKKDQLKVAGNPQVSVKKMAEGNDVEVELTVALIPEVDLPKQWKKIVSDVNADFALKHKDGSSEVDDKEVDAELARLAESRTKSEVVSRTTKDGDEVKIDFDVKVDDVVIDGGSSKDYKLILGKGAFIPGFEEQIIGMKSGEKKSFELSFPDKYHAEHLAGKPAVFDVVLHEVSERSVPELNDAFAVSLGGSFKTLAELRANIAEGMASERLQSFEESRKTSYLEKLSDVTEVVIPQALIDDEIARMVSEMEGQVSQSGMSFDQYLEGMGKTREDLSEMWSPQAKKRIVSALLLEKLGDELAVDPDSGDVEVEMNKTLAMYQGMEDMEEKIDMKQLYEYTKGILRNNQVFDILKKQK